MTAPQSARRACQGFWNILVLWPCHKFPRQSSQQRERAMANVLPKTVPKTMTAIEIKQFGGPEQLVPATRPVPAPGPGEVLIEVAAAAVNRPDVLQRQG